jgi:hypothetical protein
MIASGSQREFNGNAIKAAVGELGGSAASAVIGIIGVQKAAQKFSDDWVQMREYEVALKNALETFEKADKELQKILRRQQLCKEGKAEPQKKEEPKANPKPKQTKPTPKPTKPKPSTEEVPVQVPPGDEDIMIDPEPPAVPSRQVGLPYEPGGCGCDKSVGLTVSSESFSLMRTGMEHLNECVDNFSKGSLTEYLNTLNEWITLSGGMEKAVNTGGADLDSTIKVLTPLVESLIGRTKLFDEAGKAFLEELKACPESMKTGMEVLNSANEITIESLNLKY